MGKFINTDRLMTINTLVEGTKDKLKNPYYKYNNRSATVVTYYNINTKQTTFDEGLSIAYSNTGEDSSLTFNKIENFLIYGIEPIKLSLDDNDYGYEATGTDGEAVILPNTIEPHPGDYFIINHTNRPYLFKVTSVDLDTLESGANAYSIKYALNDDSDTISDSQVTDDFTMILDNVGTEMNPIIRSNDYNLIKELDDILYSLKKYYEELFFDSKVQTFIYIYQDRRIYDSFLIEFLIRNKLLTGTDKYVFVTHQASLPKTFSMDYDRTIFRSIELREKDNISNNTAISVLECDPNSILTSRFNDYYSITYNKAYFRGAPIEILPSDVVRKIRESDDNLYTISDPYAIYNILIQYINQSDINVTQIIDIIQRLHYCDNKELFYGIPITIYIIEYYIKSLLNTTEVTYN